MSLRVYLLGGFQTDFSQTYARAQKNMYDILREAVEGALASTQVEPREIQTAHVGNFVGELFRGQGHLGGMIASIDPAFDGLPAARHEAACASGSVATLAAASEIEAGRYEVALVAGVEEMKNVSGLQAAQNLGAAAWVGREGEAAQFMWPHLFSQLMEVYDARYGLKHEHLARIAQNNFANAKRNPNAQTRRWMFNAKSFEEDDENNPVVEGRVRKQDCGQITDGGAAVILAAENFARAYAKRRGISFDSIPYIKGWGHRTAPMLLADKLAASKQSDYIFPHVRGTFFDACKRAHIEGVAQLDGMEVHDCFTITEYMILDHIGVTAPGESWRAIEDGTIELEGALPINPSGGLVGLGHPVGATGVRMLLDAYKQVSDKAGDYQVRGAKNFGTLNIGGSATTTVSFIIGT